MKINKKLEQRSFLVFTNVTRASSNTQDKSDKNPLKEDLINLISDISEEFALNYVKKYLEFLKNVLTKLGN